MGRLTDWENYRMLNEGEIIQEGDEVLTDSHLGWQTDIHCVGQPAPYPFYTSHRMYRRAIGPRAALEERTGEENGAAIQAETRQMMLDQCCSAVSPCSHQQRDPYSLCEICARAARQSEDGR
jgi:hypothetical protein